MAISNQWSVSDIITVAIVLFGILASWFALKSDVKQLSREITLVRNDLKEGLETAAKDRELIRKEIKNTSAAAAKDRELIRQEIKDIAEAAAHDRALIRKEMSRLADQVDRLNQNYINHLSFHQGLAPKTPPR